MENLSARNYKDFSISVDASHHAQKVTYWLSGTSNGHPVEREDSAKSLVHCTVGLTNCRVYPLPQLAKGSALMPNLESVYFTDGKETGKVNITTEIIQDLQDIKVTRVARLSPKVTNRSETKKLNITLDLKQVG